MNPSIPHDDWSDSEDDDLSDQDAAVYASYPDARGTGYPHGTSGGTDRGHRSGQHQSDSGPGRFGHATVAICPRCSSTRTRTLMWGRTFGSILGAVAGAAGGAAAGCLGAPRPSVPPLRWVSLVSSAVIGGISGGTAGCRSGASLGDLLDERVLPTHQCQDCKKRFCHPNR